MKFKTPEMQEQLNKTPIILREIAIFMDDLIKTTFKREMTITRVTDPVEGESGVHLCFRAFDVRNEHINSTGNQVFLFEPAEAQYIVDTINHAYNRQDSFKTCLHHSYAGGFWHFHVQIPAKWAGPVDIKAKLGTI
jgi:hypothetical protein